MPRNSLLYWGIICLLSISILFQACAPSATTTSASTESMQIDIQGHRGARGHWPENTVLGFLKAIDMGINTLEMDVVISKDGQVLLSHEPFLSHEICKTERGEPITEETERNYNLYQMDYAEIRRCDCGTKVHARFPDQMQVQSYKPLLSEVIDSAEVYARRKNLPPLRYNIETKSTPAGDSVFHPGPGEFVDKLMAVLNEKGIKDRVTIQSFDVRTLQEAHSRYPEMELVLLVENKDGVQANVDKLGFVPQVYSPDFALLDSSSVAKIHELGMALIPWTVNDPKDIQAMLDLGVDGIISDYPDRVVEAVKEK